MTAGAARQRDVVGHGDHVRLDAANHALGEPIIATAVVAVIDSLTNGGYRLR